MRVLALDPGKLVGWARADIDDDGEWHNLEHGIAEFKPAILTLAHGQLYGTALQPMVDVIVVEDWRLYRSHAEEYIGSDMPYSQWIGMVRLVGWLSDTPVVKEEYGASRKNMARKQLHAWWPEIATLVDEIEARQHKDAHDGDAILHLWAWTIDNRKPRKHLETQDH